MGASAVYPDGTSDSYDFITVPFKTSPLNDRSHLVIRDKSGAQVDYLPSSGRGDILLDFEIPNIWLKTGTWNFYVDARPGDKDNMCLFAMSVMQRLEGGRSR